MSMKWSFLLILCLSIHQLPNRSQGLGTFVAATSDNPLLTFESLYTNGINSYLENDWARCISYLELALNDWHWWNENTARCRGRCYEEANSADLIFSKSEAYEFERVFEKMVINTLCLIKCKKQVFASRMDNAAVDVITDFKMKKPYDYLQLCYYKHGQIDNAANAAATFLATQPDHEVMQANINYYVEEGSLDIDTIVNLELGEYANEYIRGDKAYQQEKYTETIDHLEESLNLFWKAFEECRLGCENPFDQGWYPDFVSSLANHYTFTLRCKNACPSQLSNLYGEEIEDFVASIFNYLQYSYYKVGKLQKACEAVESYLFLIPDDPNQIQNKQFFWAQNGVKEKFFSPRKVVLNYKERLDYEKKLLNYIEENFIVLAESPEEDVGMPELSKETELHLAKHEARKKAVSFLKTFSSLKIHIIADEKQLKGPKRFLASGFLTDDECNILSNFTQMASVEGDGYSQKINPHTSSESFRGVTLSRASMVVLAGYVAPSVLERILSVTEFCKNYVEQYFHLNKSLYFSFTHLVCRTGLLEPSNRNLSDLSHVLHADNCILQRSGKCLKIPPAYTFRDYSAILYLNSDFEGGEFIFSKDPRGINYESIIKPKCGRLVAFSAGKENLHGVRPVMKGSRCALAMWFTFNKKYKEAERSLAEKFLKIKTDEIVPST